MLFGSPPCSPQIPNFKLLFCFFPFSDAILIKSPTPSSIETKGSTAKILFCIKNNNLFENMHNCSPTKKSFMDTKIEINKRFGMPIFIPLIGLICCFILSSRKEKKLSKKNNLTIYSIISFIILVVSEITVRYSGISFNHTLIYYFLPIVLLPLIYILLIRAFKYENLN